MKRFLIYISLAYLALSVQSIFFRGAKPDLVLVLVCFYSLRYGQAKGVTYGALTGLLIDNANGFILGPNIISKAFVGFFARPIKGKVFQWGIFINTLIVAVFAVVDILIVYICYETYMKVSFADLSWKTTIVQTIYTVASSVILYGLLHPEKDSAGQNE